MEGVKTQPNGCEQDTENRPPTKINRVEKLLLGVHRLAFILVSVCDERSNLIRNDDSTFYDVPLNDPAQRDPAEGHRGANCPDEKSSDGLLDGPAPDVLTRGHRADIVGVEYQGR